MWQLYAFISLMLYALGEIFQKSGSDFEDEHSALKMLIWFGIFGGLTAFAISSFGLRTQEMTAFEALRQNPAALLSPLCYYLSLLLCFLALKLIPVSIIAPITGLDGVLTFSGVIIMYLLIGKSAILDESITPIKLLLVLLTFSGVYLCGLIQNQEENKEENRKIANGRHFIKSGRFAIIGIALTFCSAMLDAASSLTDIYFLGEFSESYDYIFIHETLIFCFAVVVYFILCGMEKRMYNPFSKKEIPKFLGAGCDCAATVFYMMAVAKNQIYTDVIVSSFCVFTVLMSRMFLKEKIGKKQQLCITLTMLFIVVFAAVDELL